MNKRLPEHLVGNDVGQLKLEHSVTRGYFSTNKIYCIVVYNAKQNAFVPTIKIKRGDSKNPEKETFKSLIYKEDVSINKYSNLKSYPEGSVWVNLLTRITIRADSYTKRTKLYYTNKVWIDTKPLNINMESSLIKPPSNDNSGLNVEPYLETTLNKKKK